MKLTEEDVKKIARLARLRLTDEEVTAYRIQLSDVLKYIEQLDEVSTALTPTTAQVTDQVNRLADDTVVNQPRTKELLANAPLTEGTHIKVKAVFDE